MTFVDATVLTHHHVARLVFESLMRLNLIIGRSICSPPAFHNMLGTPAVDRSRGNIFVIRHHVLVSCGTTRRDVNGKSVIDLEKKKRIDRRLASTARYRRP